MHVTHVQQLHAHTHARTPAHSRTQKRSAGFSKSVFLLFFSPSFLPPFSHPRVFLPAPRARQFLLYTILRKLPHHRLFLRLSSLQQLFFLPHCLLVVTFNGSSRRTIRAKLRLLGRGIKEESKTRFSRNVGYPTSIMMHNALISLPSVHRRDTNIKVLYVLDQ